MSVGIALCLCAAVLMSGGNLLEKRAVTRLGTLSMARPLVMVRALFGSLTWTAGFCCNIAAVVIQLVAFSITPIVVVQSIYAAGLVVITIGARRWIGESMRSRELYAVAAIIVAVLLVVLSISQRPRTHLSASASTFVLVEVVSAALTALLFVASRRLASSSAGYGVVSGLLYGMAGLAGTGAAALVQRYGVASSVGRIVASPYPYLLAVASVPALLVFQKGIQVGRIAIISPVQGVVSSLYIVVGGMLLFAQPPARGVLDRTLELIGFAGVMACIAVIAHGETREPAAAPAPKSPPQRPAGAVKEWR